MEVSEICRAFSSSTSSTKPLNDVNGPSHTVTCSPMSKDTDGFGRSDSREALRSHFEVDRYYITITALSALVESGKKKPKDVADAIKKYGIDPEKQNPLYA